MSILPLSSLMNVVNASQSPGVTIWGCRKQWWWYHQQLGQWLQCSAAIPRNLSHVAPNKHMEFLLCKHLPHYHHSSFVWVVMLWLDIIGVHEIDTWHECVVCTLKCAVSDRSRVFTSSPPLYRPAQCTLSSCTLRCTLSETPSGGTWHYSPT